MQIRQHIGNVRRVLYNIEPRVLANGHANDVVHSLSNNAASDSNTFKQRFCFFKKTTYFDANCKRHFLVAADCEVKVVNFFTQIDACRCERTNWRRSLQTAAQRLTRQHANKRNRAINDSEIATTRQRAGGGRGGVCGRRAGRCADSYCSVVVDKSVTIRQNRIRKRARGRCGAPGD